MLEVQWDADLPEGTEMRLLMQFFEKGTWTVWQRVHADIDAKKGGEEALMPNVILDRTHGTHGAKRSASSLFSKRSASSLIIASSDRFGSGISQYFCRLKRFLIRFRFATIGIRFANGLFDTHSAPLRACCQE